MVIRELLAKTIKNLKENKIVAYSLEATILLKYALNCDNTFLVIHANDEVASEKIALVDALVNRRIAGEPVQYITGTQEFMSLDFVVTKDVLIPRSDTEILVESVLNWCKGKENLRILDIGTGSGAIAISLSHYLPNAKITAVDISKKALDVARQNAVNNGVEKSVSFVECDILSEIPKGEFDVIVSNPPYIKPEVIANLESQVKDFEPYNALYGGDDGLLFYKRICEIAPSMLCCGGLLAFEIGCEQANDVKALMRDFSCVSVEKDLSGLDRVVKGEYNCAN